MNIKKSYSIEDYKNLYSQLHKHGIKYRLNKRRYEKLLKSNWKNVIPKHLFITASANNEFYDAVLSTSLTEIPISKGLSNHFEIAGELTRVFIMASEKLLEQFPQSFNFFFKSPKSEISFLGKNKEPQVFYRTDYLMSNDHNIPKIVDINLLPGMMFTNQKLTSAINRVKNKNDKIEFDLSTIFVDFMSKFKNWSKIKEPPKVAIIIRKNHGLHTDMINLKGFFTKKNILSEIIHPNDIINIKSHFIHTTKGDFNCIFRMIRPVTKHYVSKNDYEDNQKKVIKIIDYALKDQLFVYPQFNAYLENNFWIWAWQSLRYKNFYSSLVGKDNYKNMQKYLPKTYLVNNTNTCIDPNEQVIELSEEFLRNIVVKQGDTTGSKEVIILNKSTKNQRINTLDYIKTKFENGLILQELLPSKKNVITAFSNDRKLSSIKGNTQFLCYYSSSKLLGAVGVVSQNSKKIHGGSNSFTIPLYIYNR
jgi:hypothetical protein